MITAAIFTATHPTPMGVHLLLPPQYSPLLSSYLSTTTAHYRLVVGVLLSHLVIIPHSDSTFTAGTLAARAVVRTLVSPETSITLHPMSWRDFAQSNIRMSFRMLNDPSIPSWRAREACRMKCGMGGGGVVGELVRARDLNTLWLQNMSNTLAALAPQYNTTTPAMTMHPIARSSPCPPRGSARQ